MNERDFIEVETPILQPLYGGAAARPFTTHHNALDTDMYLRIAPELYLKRCIAGDLERVYEIGKNFRNEGISPRHNPEFTVIEYYQAYADYTEHSQQVEELVHRIAVAISHPDPGQFAPPWPRIRLHEAILELTGIDILASSSAFDLREAMAATCIRAGEEASWAELVDELQSLVERTLDRPTFIIDHPVALSPLAKIHRDDPRLTERFEAFINGVEIANAFTELNDPGGAARAVPRLSRPGRACAPARRGLPRRARSRHAADRGMRDRDRQADHAAHRLRQHPRRDPLPGEAAARLTDSRNLRC